MALKSLPIVVQLYAYAAATGLPVAGDTANWTLKVTKDGTAGARHDATALSEPDATNQPGVVNVSLDATDMAADVVTVGGKSSTSGVVIVPITLVTEHGVIGVTPGAIPAAVAGAANGLALVGSVMGKSAATIAAGDIATDAITAASLKADAVTKMQAGLATSTEVTSIQNNTRVVRVVPTVIERPDSSTKDYRIELLAYDEVGNMEAPDAAPTIGVVNEAGTSRDDHLDSTTMTLVSTGRYRSVYTAVSTDAIEQLVFTFSVVEGGNTRAYGNTAQVVDTTAVDFTAADRLKLEQLATDYTTARAGKIDNLDAAVSTRGTGTALTAGDVRTAIGLAAADLDTQLAAVPTRVWSFSARTITGMSADCARAVWRAIKSLVAGGV